MSAGLVQTAFFCLSTGAALGCLFLLCKVLRLLLRLGKVWTAVMDILFCAFCGMVLFLCALAVDKGRFRLFQAVFQGLGAWCAIEVFDPFVSRAAKLLRSMFCKVHTLLGRGRAFWRARFRKKSPGKEKSLGKRGKKPKKAQKKT